MFRYRLIKGQQTGESAVVETHDDGTLTVSGWLTATEEAEIIANPAIMRNVDCDFEFSDCDLPGMIVVVSV